MNVSELSNEEITHYHKQILSKFKPIKDYPLDAYYGVAFMTTKKQDAFQLRLQYDYGKKPINGPIVEAATLEDAMLMLHILMLKRNIVAAEIPTLVLTPLPNPEDKDKI